MQTVDTIRTVRRLALGLLTAATLAAASPGFAICGNPAGCGSPRGGTVDCGKTNACSECNAGPLACCLTPPCTILNPPPPPPPKPTRDVFPTIRREFGHGFIFTR